MPKMISFGDSFTWGSDLSDTMQVEEWSKHTNYWKKQNNYHNLYSRRTWQAMLAKENNLEYVCLAQAGCSNQTMVRHFFENVHLIESDDVVTVGFTWRDRYDFWDDTNKQWETVRPSGTEDSQFFELYYKQIQSSHWDQIESLKAINLIIGYLKLNNIKFIVTCLDHLIYKDCHHTSPLIETLQNIHKDDIVWFDDLGFFEWSKRNNFEISPMWHPLDDAHKAALEYIRKEF